MSERSLFIAALEIDDPDQRNEYLRATCGADLELRERVERLLSAHREAGGVLDRPLPEDEPTTFLHATAAGAGLVIAGRYKLLEEIGEGGMGTVWVAQQTEPIRRRVALKLIKPGMDSRQVLSRFEAERQALALMDHPYIAKILDGGVTDQGRPFFVMEFVKGVPITDFCDRAKLSVAERLKLFMQVCQAVQHAHQKGIIHRDLKPSNILVCLYDGRPVPKVIDFGLAKAMHNSLTEHTLYTAHGLMVGTPLYMSPEQAEFNNLDIDTRTDVYSLGVILYELLTGTTPLDRQRFKDAAWQEIVRLIKEEEAAKPSTKLSGSGSLPSIAAQRSLEPAQLSRAVRGDLDWIVMKTLEKERSRRYETANGLARDIERFLNDQPVEACPPAGSYRFRKFARRNRVALGTASLVSLALIAGTIVSSWQAVRALRAERVAETERAQAEQARATEAEQRAIAESQRQSAEAARVSEAEQRQVAEDERAEALRQRADAEANFHKARTAVDDYFTLVSESTLLEVPGLQPLRKDLLERALRFYEESSESRTNDSRVLAETAITYLRVGMIYFSLNRTDDSIVAIRKALDLVDRLRGAGPDAVGQLPRVAGFWRGLRWTQFLTFQPRDPIGTFTTLLRLEKTWSQLAEQFPTEVAFQSDLAPVQGLLGFALDAAGRRKQSEASHRKAIALLRRLLQDRPKDPQYRNDFLVGVRNMAPVVLANGDAEGAQALLCEAVQIGESLIADFPKNPNYRYQLSECHRVLGRQIGSTQPKQSLEHLRRAAELAQGIVREYPGIATYYKAWGYAASGWLQFSDELGDRDQAENALRESVRTQEIVAAYRHDETAPHLELAATMLKLAQRLANDPQKARDAESLHRRALDTFSRVVEINEHRSAETPEAIDQQQFFQLREAVNGNSGNADQQVLIKKAHSALAGTPYYVDWCAISGHWGEAAAGLQKHIAEKPDDPRPWFQAAVVFAIQGDMEKYRRHCDAMLARFGSTKNPGIAAGAAKASIILAPPPAQLGEARGLAQRAVTAGSTHQAVREYQLAQALADYRGGEFSKAGEWLAKCLDSGQGMGGYGIAMAKLLGVMVQSRLGNKEQAQAEWLLASQFCESLPHLERGQLLYPFDWEDGIGVELLRREAERLVMTTSETDAKTALERPASPDDAVAEPR